MDHCDIPVVKSYNIRIVKPGDIYISPLDMAVGTHLPDRNGFCLPKLGADCAHLDREGVLPGQSLRAKRIHPVGIDFSEHVILVLCKIDEMDGIGSRCFDPLVSPGGRLSSGAKVEN